MKSRTDSTSRGSGGCSLFYGILLVLFLFVAVTSAQITFSRQWVRGKYPGDEAGENPEFQRAAKAVLPKRTFSRYVKPAPASADYIPILVNAHMLEQVLERMKETPFVAAPLSSALSATSLENVKK